MVHAYVHVRYARRILWKTGATICHLGRRVFDTFYFYSFYYLSFFFILFPDYRNTSYTITYMYIYS